MKSISYEEALLIHNSLVEEFNSTDNPIFPPGIKDTNMLHSAISRQHTSLGDEDKYNDPFSCAATVLYGIILDHPFHNGNKRTALVSMLVHLDKNNYSIVNTSENELFQFLLAIAQHKLLKPSRHSKIIEIGRPNQDEEVNVISKWLREHTKEIARGDRPLTVRRLRPIIEKHGYVLGDPKGNKIKVYRKVDNKLKHIGNLGYQNENAELSIRAVKELRIICKLREEDGVDSDAFYGEGEIINGFINRHRKIIKLLARK